MNPKCSPRQGPELKGRTKRTNMIKPSVPKPPPSPGDTVWYANGKEAWHTGTFVRVIERTGENFGKCLI